MDTKNPVITRFPPSPTGYLHIGRARTALFNYLFAKHNKGKMVFRIEDTDKERSKREYEENIIDCLKWLGISYDNTPVRQSERTEIYKKYLKKMVDDGYAYISKEDSLDKEGNGNEGPEKKEAGKEGRREEVIRFKNPNKKIVFEDLVRGRVEFDTTDLNDFVIAKSLDEPLYHLTVVVDDHEMGITHVIRGEDGISNTPRQILIQEAIGAARPLYAHIPLILSADRSKLSGRHGAVAVTDYRDKGYLPEAVINFLALLGWNPGTDQEIFSLEELIPAFDLSKVQKAGAVFNIDKLNWFNHQYILKLSDVEFLEHARAFMPEWLIGNASMLNKLVPVMREKIIVFRDIDSLLKPGGELAFVKELTDYVPTMLLWKKNPNADTTRKHLASVKEIISKLPSANSSNPATSDSIFNPDTIKSVVFPYAEANGRGDVLWPLRVALTGQDKSPDPFTSAAILGHAESIRRIDLALSRIAQVKL